jgi:predicted  nucleic acid-binding Zn-ribbon protein
MSDNGKSYALHKALQEIGTLNEKLQQAEARVAELSEKSDRLSYAIVHSLTDKQQDRFARQFAELQDAIAASSSVAWLLRKQAEAVEAATNEHEIKSPTDDSKCYSVALRDYAKRLRQQADEAERAGGEK